MLTSCGRQLGSAGGLFTRGELLGAGLKDLKNRNKRYRRLRPPFSPPRARGGIIRKRGREHGRFRDFASPIQADLIDPALLKPGLLPLDHIHPRGLRKHLHEIGGRGASESVLLKITLNTFAKIILTEKEAEFFQQGRTLRRTER